MNILFWIISSSKNELKEWFHELSFKKKPMMIFSKALTLSRVDYCYVLTSSFKMMEIAEVKNVQKFSTACTSSGKI